jgi:hypothetical protein
LAVAAGPPVKEALASPWAAPVCLQVGAATPPPQVTAWLPAATVRPAGLTVRAPRWKVPLVRSPVAASAPWVMG